MFLWIVSLICTCVSLFLLIFGCKDKTVEAKTADGKKSWLRYDTKKMVRYLVLAYFSVCFFDFFGDMTFRDPDFWTFLFGPLARNPHAFITLALWIVFVRRMQRRELDEAEQRKREEELVLRDQRIAEMKQAAEQEKAQTEAEDSEPAAADKE